MDRRRFLANSALIASGAIAADQLGLIEKLGELAAGWKRRFFPGADFSGTTPITTDDLNAMLKEFYSEPMLNLDFLDSPLVSRLSRPRSLLKPDAFEGRVWVFGVNQYA